MMSPWSLVWVVLMFAFLVPSLGYGWGYRHWGPPFPSYIQRRRAEKAAAMGGTSSFNHQSWGLHGDIVWAVMILGVFWVFAAVWLL